MGLFRFKIKRHDKSWVTRGDQLVTKRLMEQAAKVLLNSIHREIDRERAMEAGKDGGKLPITPKFKASFRCLVVGKEIQIVSTWPNLDALIEGRKPYQMKWLTQQAGVDVVPMEGAHDQILFRRTPLHKEDAWWHPGYRKHEFLDRAIERAWPKMEKILREGVMKELSSLPPV